MQVINPDQKMAFTAWQYNPWWYSSTTGMCNPAASHILLQKTATFPSDGGSASSPSAILIHHHHHHHHQHIQTAGQNPLLFILSAHHHRHFCQPSPLIFSNISLLLPSFHGDQKYWCHHPYSDHPDLRQLYLLHDLDLEIHRDNLDQADQPDHSDQLDQADEAIKVDDLSAQVAASVADRLTATQCSVHTTQPWSVDTFYQKTSLGSIWSQVNTTRHLR